MDPCLELTFASEGLAATPRARAHEPRRPIKILAMPALMFPFRGFSLLPILIAATGVTVSCGTSHAVLNFTAPSATTAGSPFTITVTATIGGERDTVINSVITFTSSDPAAILPAQYQFTDADRGSHIWTNGFVLDTPGNQTISATMFDAKGINGTASIAVSP